MTALADGTHDIRSPLKLAVSFVIDPISRASYRETNQIHNVACDRFGRTRACYR